MERVKRATGLDRAVAFTLLARLCSILSSIGTVLLIIRFMSSVEQGYYYTLLSLAALQVVFELGFSFVILQMAAHESASLVFLADGRILGDALVRTRLASLLQFTVKWYLRAAVALAGILLPVGILFFSVKSTPGAHVAWLGPWVAAVLSLSVNFLLTPIYSFIEGCNQVREAAKLRMCQAVAVLISSWSAVASGHGLYACALVNAGVVAVGAVFLYTRRRLLLNLLHCDVTGGAISWRREVWPFQWQVAVSWVCSYFTLQAFTPILFASRGPLEAGRFGLSLSITAYLPVVMLSWIETKAAPFGRLIKLGRLHELDTLFSRAMKQSLGLILLLAGACFATVLVVERLSPRIAERMETPPVFALLLAAAVCTFVVQGMAVYLRSFKREPYLVQSLVVMSLTLGCALIAAPKWGEAAVVVVYFLFGGLGKLLWAVAIFYADRRNRSRADEPAVGDRDLACKAAAIPNIAVRVTCLQRNTE